MTAVAVERDLANPERHGEAAGPAPTPEPSRRILVVEDEEDTRQSFQQLLGMALGVDVDLAVDGAGAGDAPEAAVQHRHHRPADAQLDGMELIEEIQKRRLPVTVIVTTGLGSIDDAVQAMRLGAYDFLTKPLRPEHLCLLVERALRERTLQDEVAALRQQIGERHAFRNIISKSPRMHDIFELIGHIAETTTTVLIEGETGTGKELIAQAIHQASATHRTGAVRRRQLRGAARDAAGERAVRPREGVVHRRPPAQRKGRFELADGGTLFLDEIGDIPLPMQAKLLRVLQERQFERVGGNETIEVDVRVIAATNRSLERTGQGRASSAKTSTTGSTSSRSTCRRSASGPRTSRSWPPTSPRSTPGPARTPTRSRRGDGAAARLPLAGQHPPAGERHRAGLRHAHGRRDPAREPAAATCCPRRAARPRSRSTWPGR